MAAWCAGSVHGGNLSPAFLVSLLFPVVHLNDVDIELVETGDFESCC